MGLQHAEHSIQAYALSLPRLASWYSLWIITMEAAATLKMKLAPKFGILIPKPLTFNIKICIKELKKENKK
jgi:hypothetical protein